MKRKAIESNYVFKGKIINLRIDEFSLTADKKIKREVVEHPGSVVIVPILDKNKVVLIKQYRYAIGREILELPAGTLNNAERPLECAKRELLEETGYKAKYFKRLGSVYLAPGYCNELIRIYLARDLKYKGRRVEEDEEIEVTVLNLKDAFHDVLKKRFYDAKTICGLYLAVNAFKEAK